MIIVGLAAASAAAARWTPWTPLNTCLFCGTAQPPATIAIEHSQPSAAVAQGTRVREPLARSRDGAPAESTDPLLPVGSATGGAGSAASSAGSLDNQRDWQPWSTTASARSGGSEAMLLNGLAALSGTSIVGGGSTVRATTAASPSPSAPENADKVSPPVDPPHAAPEPPSPPSGGAAPVPPSHPIDPPTPPMLLPSPPDAGGFAPNIPVAPTDPFHQHDAPGPAPFSPQAPNGPLGGSDPSGPIPTGGAPAATPEPASVMLMATGLLAVLGELRRRRAL